MKIKHPKVGNRKFKILGHRKTFQNDRLLFSVSHELSLVVSQINHFLYFATKETAFLSPAGAILNFETAFDSSFHSCKVEEKKRFYRFHIFVVQTKHF